MLSRLFMRQVLGWVLESILAPEAYWNLSLTDTDPGSLTALPLSFLIYEMEIRLTDIYCAFIMCHVQC